MKKLLIFLTITLLFLMPVYGSETVEVPEKQEVQAELEDETITDDIIEDTTDNTDEEWDWKSKCDSFENAIETYNIDVWKVEDNELETMYGDTHILRRKPNTNNAWIVYELPYINKLSFMIYGWPIHEGEIEVFLSKDGEEWIDGEMEVTRIPAPEDSNCWTKFLYEAEDITGIRYVKLIWPAVDESHNDWWNPYMGWIRGSFEESRPTNIKTEVPEEIILPRFESKSFQLKAELVDQIDKAIDIPVTWTAKSLPEGVSLTADILLIDSNCTGDDVAELEVSAEYNGEIFSLPVIVKFIAPVIGDTDSDMKITQSDVEFVLKYYGTDNECNNWNEIRLADIDKNGLIDIIDISYICYNCIKE